MRLAQGMGTISFERLIERPLSTLGRGSGGSGDPRGDVHCRLGWEEVTQIDGINVGQLFKGDIITAVDRK